MPTSFRFALRDLPPEAEALRKEVREFLHETIDRPAGTPREKTWGGFNRDFSKKVGQRGWIGMTWPKKYGGHERTFLERYVVLEEMLAGGAPVSAHWVADRQSGPLLLRFGTEAQRQKILPGITRGELAFAIGMSEPDSGSDLASIRSRATRAEAATCSTARRCGRATRISATTSSGSSVPGWCRTRSTKASRNSSSISRIRPASPSGPSSISPASTTSTR